LSGESASCPENTCRPLAQRRETRLQATLEVYGLQSATSRPVFADMAALAPTHLTWVQARQLGDKGKPTSAAESAVFPRHERRDKGASQSSSSQMQSHQKKGKASPEKATGAAGNKARSRSRSLRCLRVRRGHLAARVAALSWPTLPVLFALDDAALCSSGQSLRAASLALRGHTAKK